LFSILENQTELAKVIKIEQRHPGIFTKLDAYVAWKADAEEKAIKGLKESIKDIEITKELVGTKLEK